MVGVTAKLLSDGVQWAVLSIDAPPRMSLSLTIQSKDADAASALRGTIVSALASVPGTEGTKNRYDLIKPNDWNTFQITVWNGIATLAINGQVAWEQSSGGIPDQPGYIGIECDDPEPGKIRATNQPPSLSTRSAPIPSYCTGFLSTGSKRARSSW